MKVITMHLPLRRAFLGQLMATVYVFTTVVGGIAAVPPVNLRTTDNFALLSGSTVTNTGNSVVNGDLGLYPGSSVTGFPPGVLIGAQHIGDPVAIQAKTDLTSAYKDAAGRPYKSVLLPDVGGQLLTDGVYRTGSVASLGLTGNLTLDGQGDPRAVFIFQIQSTLTTASGSSVSLINGAQSCNVYWQVGSSATLGSTTAFTGTILALSSITVNNGATIDGELFARNGQVSLIDDVIGRSQCSPGTEYGTGSLSPGADSTGPQSRITGIPSGNCPTRNFTARFRIRDGSGIERVYVYLDGRRLTQTTRTRFSLVVRVTGLRVGNHRIRVVAFDRAGNRSVTNRRFQRCALAAVLPWFTG